MEYLLLVLACPVGMGVMMWFMMRTKRVERTTAVEELGRPRAEVADRRAARPPRG